MARVVLYECTLHSLQDTAKATVDQVMHSTRFLILLTATLTACSRPRTQASMASIPQRHHEHVFHADVQFGDRQRDELRQAAFAWTEATKGLARFRIIFDSEAAPNYLHVVKASNREVRGLTAKQIDDSTPNVEENAHVLACIKHASRTNDIYFVVARIPTNHFREVAVHEFGPYLGLPDIDTPGAMMSGMKDLEAKPLAGLTQTDTIVCERYNVCR